MMNRIIVEHSFPIDLARDVGVEEATMLKNIYYWVAKNRANKKHKFEGKYWTYNTMKAFEELFPYWTYNQIRRILTNLEDKGFIEVDNFNEHAYDRTRWYTLTEKGWSYFEKSDCAFPQMEDDVFTNASVRNHTPIPNDKPYNKPYTKKYTKKDLFETFWKQYPKKRNKGQAERAFKKMVKDKETLDLILEDLERRKNFEDWIKADGQFIPYPSTYLNAQGWLDEYDVIDEKITKEIGEFT